MRGAGLRLASTPLIRQALAFTRYKSHPDVTWERIVSAEAVRMPAGTPAAEAVAAAGLPAAGPKAIVVVRDPSGRLRDLDWAPELDTEVAPVALDSPDGLNVLRHSTAHVLAQAVQD